MSRAEEFAKARNKSILEPIYLSPLGRFRVNWYLKFGNSRISYIHM